MGRWSHGPSSEGTKGEVQTPEGPPTRSRARKAHVLLVYDIRVILFWKRWGWHDIATIWIVNCMSWINLYQLRREYNHFKNTITDGVSTAAQSKVLSGSYNWILRRKLVLQKHLTVLTISRTYIIFICCWRHNALSVQNILSYEFISTVRYSSLSECDEYLNILIHWYNFRYKYLIVVNMNTFWYLFASFLNDIFGYSFVSKSYCGRVWRICEYLNIFIISIWICVHTIFVSFF